MHFYRLTQQNTKGISVKEIWEIIQVDLIKQLLLKSSLKNFNSLFLNNHI